MKFIITLVGVLITNILFACDFCGAFMGITPYDNQSCITIMYRYKSFNGYCYSPQTNNVFPQRYEVQNTKTPINTTKHKHLTEKPDAKYSQSDYEIYTTAEMRMKYFIHKRIEISTIIPFVINSSRIDADKEVVRGIGDINIFSAYHLITPNINKTGQHRLIVGLGIKAPTGNYNKKNEEGERIDFLMQAGSGSRDYIGYINYIYGYKKVGINFNSIYKINGQNRFLEKFANSTTNYLNLFCRLRQDKDLKLYPSLQGYYEYSKGEYISNIHQSNTTISTFTAGLGIDIFYKNFSLNSSFQLPVYENEIANNLSMSGKFTIALSYNFNQSNYLIKSKK